MRSRRLGVTLATGVLVVLTAGAALVLWPQASTQAAAASSDSPAPRVNEPIQPLPPRGSFDPLRVALGRRLFHDRRLSVDDTIACSSCHDVHRGGVDRATRSLGVLGKVGAVNSPSVLNAALNFAQFWDGRASSLEEQMDGPVTSPDEMASSWNDIVRKLGAAPDYITEFAAGYPDGLTIANTKNALATYERSLHPSAPSRFDRYLLGDRSAIDDVERRGYETFKAFGCISCHQGVGIGGNMFQTFGVMADYFADRGHVTKADYGRFNVTGEERDRYVFKVPTLRNVALTPPYFHDGSAATLEEAVTVMARYQLGRELSKDDLGAIVRFLETLTGEYSEPTL